MSIPSLTAGALPPTLPVNVCTLFMAALIFGAFVVLLFVGSLLAPGKLEPGAPLAGGERRIYKLNGLLLFVGLLALVLLGWATDLFSLAVLHAYFWPLLVVANLFAVALTTYLFVTGRQALRARGETPASDLAGMVKELFFGVELNPTLFGLDLKMFSYRPSLMGLALLNLSFAFVQYQHFGFVSTRMWLFQLFFLCYVINYFQFEYGMLYTWDIIAEKFGWMLVFGDYVVVPFFYSLAGWYLVGRVDPLPTWELFFLVGLYLGGFWLFRGANEQKHQYKVNPQAIIWGKPAEALGGRLLVSGFWGIGRKLNYTGELCMYLAWTIPVGLCSPVPYLLPLWLAGLFGHRAWRDEQRCSEKYGPLWSEYCQRARFRMIPFIY